MKIAMITPGYLPVPAIRGGAVEVLIEDLLIGNETDRNYDIDLYTVPDKEIDEREYRFTNIIQVNIPKTTKIINGVMNQVYKMLHRKKWRTSYAREVVRLLKKKSYDLVVIHNNLMAYRDIYEKTPNKKNLIYILHNDINEKDENHVILAKQIGKTAKAVFAVSEYTKNQFLHVAQCGKADVLYNCIDIDHYTQKIDAEDIAKSRLRYGIAPEDFVFMYSGRFDIYKGVLELIRAVKMLDDKNIKLMVVGKSWFDTKERSDAYTQQLSEESDAIKEKVIFTGFVNPTDMPKMYRMADCLVVPSVWEEPFGVVALEGMISGLPLIATNSGGLVEVVDEECAYIVEKEEHVSEHLAEAMQKVLKDKPRARKMGENGYAKVMKTRAFHKEAYYSIFCEKLGI